MPNPGYRCRVTSGLIALFCSLSMTLDANDDVFRDGFEVGEGPSLACETLAATTATGVPLTRVALTGLAGADTETDFVRVEAEGYAAYPTALYGNEADGYELLVPPHPDGPTGGTLQLIVTDGDRRCPAIAFDVLPLPAHEGDPVSELAAALEAVADAYASNFGVDSVALAATPLDQLPPELVPLAVLFEGLDAVNLVTELTALDPDEVNLLQDLLGVIDLAPRLNDFAGQVGSLPPSSAPLTVPSFRAEAAGPFEEGVGASECVDLGSVDPGRFDVTTPDNLAKYLEAARGAADSIGPLREGISDLNSGFVLLGLVPGTGWGGFAIGQIWSWGSYLTIVVQEMRANLYPSSIDRLTFELDETRIPEDWDLARDGKIEWSFAKLFASNNGMNVARVIADGTTNVVSSAAALGSAAGSARGFVSTPEAQAVAVLDVAGRSAIDGRLEELEGNEETVECWNIGSTEFGPTVVDDNTSDQWVIPSVVNGESISVNDREITPVRIGSSALRVETNTENLPGPRGFADRVVEVARKSVTWLPSTLFVEKTGQPEMVKVRFDDTKHFGPDDVSFEYDPSLNTPFEISLGNGVYEVYFTTPDERELYPLKITAKSTSAELPPNTPLRQATMTIETRESIEISPRNRCVPNGDDLTLTAEVSSIDENPLIEWERAGAGTLIVPGTGQQASYVAPASGSGQVTLRAFLSADPDVEDEVTLTYGNCVPLAIFYELDASYTVPGLEPGCLGFAGGDSFEIRNDNANNDGKNPEIPLAADDFWGPGQSFSIDEAAGTPGVRGSGPPAECVTASFPAEYANATDITVGSSGDIVNYDIRLIANAACATFPGALVEDCSDAQAFSGIWARYDFEIERATTYRLEVNLSCTSTISRPIPIDALFYRADADGNAILTNRDFAKAKFIESADCQDGTGTIDVTFELDAPLVEGTTDRLTVTVVTAVQANALPDLGEDSDVATLSGTVRLREVQN